MKNISTALVRLNKRAYYYFSRFSVPISRVIKYPILLGSLLNRIKDIQLTYSLGSPIRVFNLRYQKGLARLTLKGKGGVYIFFCTKTGLFYVGSALRFFDKQGRLNDYFMPGRVSSVLAGESTKISRLLAKDIQEHGIETFILITVEEFDSDTLIKPTLVEFEQLWMLLNPTYNISLFASSNDGQPMSEETRITMSNRVYQYELVNGAFSSSVRIINGIKELFRQGVVTLEGTVLPIQYDILVGCISSGLLWKNFILFSLTELSTDQLALIAIKNIPEPAGKGIGVWVYDFDTHELIAYEPSVKVCLAKYNVSSTHFKRIRKFKQAFNGMLFSNSKLY